jgi:hypothetical protein
VLTSGSLDGDLGAVVDLTPAEPPIRRDSVDGDRIG